MLKSSSSEEKLVKPLKNCVLDPICIEKESLWTTPKMKKNIFFGRNKKNRSSAFRKFLFYQNIMFWLSYESFSINQWCFLSKKCHFQLKQLCSLYNHYLFACKCIPHAKYEKKTIEIPVSVEFEFSKSGKILT